MDTGGGSAVSAVKNYWHSGGFLADFRICNDRLHTGLIESLIIVLKYTTKTVVADKHIE
jgi:hypothetical protein